MLHSEVELHPWAKDALLWLYNDFNYQTGALEDQALVYFKNYHAYKSPWWYWQGLYHNVFFAYRTGDYATLASLLAELTAVADQNEFVVCKSDIFRLKALSLRRSWDLDKTLLTYQQAVEYARETENNRALCAALNNIGILYSELGDYDSALQFMEESAEHDKMLEGKALTYTNIGEVYFLKGDYLASFNSYQKANELVKTLEKPVRAVGFIYLGYGLNQACSGHAQEALVYFNRAMEEFIKYNNLHAQVYLHGMVGRVFYDNKEFTLARLHLQQFITKLEILKRYDAFFPYYCFYVLTLLDQQQYAEAEHFLIVLQTLAADYKKNPLMKTWYNFVLGVALFDKLDFTNAEQHLELVVMETQMKGPYELSLRSLIVLCELLLRKYILLNNSALLTKIEQHLELATKIGDEHPIYPTVIFIKLYKAMLASSKGEWAKMEHYLTEVQDSMQKFGNFSLRKRISGTIDQIRSKRLIEGDFSRDLAGILRLGSGRQKIATTIKAEEFGLIIWKLTENGPETVGLLVPEQLIGKEGLGLISMFLGTLLITVLGQGDRYHQGIFGPLPVPITGKQLVCLIASKIIRDSRQTDPRLEGQNFAIVAVLYSAIYDMDRHLLAELFSSWWDLIQDFSQFDEQFLEQLQAIILQASIKLS